jgi:23S rRNA pseudouridine2604 synthase
VENINDYSVNINKYISSTGICSRRDAEKYITQGQVTINGKVAVLGNRVFNGDTVLLDGKPLTQRPKTLYIAFNKPVGIVSTTDSKEKNNLINYINHPKRLFPIGRLDKASQGLIFLTNDGDIVNKVLRAGNQHEKEYVVKVNKAISPDFLVRMQNGIPILGTVTKKCQCIQVSTTVFKIVLIQGLNRQIRRMCEYLGYEVMELTRIRIMNVHLGKMKIGEWRELNEQEITTLNKLVKHSSKTEEASVDTQKNRPSFAPKDKSRRKRRPRY